MTATPAPLLLHKHVRSTLLDSILQMERNAQEVDRMLPPERGEWRAAITGQLRGQESRIKHETWLRAVCT